jgi:DNA replication protein DnaC
MDGSPTRQNQAETERTMNRKQLIKANDALLARRKKENIGQPQPISRPASRLATHNGMTIGDYFTALHNGEEVTERQAIYTSRAQWDSFDDERHPKLKAAVKAVKKWYNERIEAGGGIILAGGFGTGKTHLARAVYELYGMQAIFWEEDSLLRRIRSTYNGNRGQSEEGLVKQCRRAKLFVFDDLGAYETGNLNWVQNIYRGLFDGRFEEGKATMITTNLSCKASSGEKSEFEVRVGGKNFSRIIGQLELPEYYVDLFCVGDYRLREFNK